MRLTRYLLGACHLFAVLIHDVSATKVNHCPPLGPVLPAPTSPSSYPAVQSAVSAVKDIIDGLTATFNSTAVSVGVKSLHETTPMVNVHYAPPVLDPRGASHINASTVYRIASISKLLAVLATLKTSGVRMEDPVTKYLPRLRELKRQQNGIVDQTTAVDWDDVTIQALASHMGGISSDLIIDMASTPLEWTQLGLPPVREVLGCSGLGGLPPCNETAFWDNFGKRNPVFSSDTSPLYSNAAFIVLSLVVESVSGISFSNFVQKNVLDKVGMPSTTYTKPDDKLGAISLNDTTWNANLGIESPAGNYYSNTEDLLALGVAILSNRILSPAQTRRWLKPVTFTSASGMFFGAPWEIFRGDNVTSDQRLIEFYTKAGDLGTYHSILALVPDYGLVVSILTSGPEGGNGPVPELFSQIVTALLPAVEAAGKAEAQATFAGTYVDEATNSTLTLGVDDEGPGLRITGWVVRGTDVLARWINYMSATTDSLPEVQTAARLYPSGLVDGGRTAWRVIVELGSPEDTAGTDSRFFWPQASCTSWGVLDTLVYEFGAINEMIFSLAETGSGNTATNVEFVGFRATLLKVEQDQAENDL